MTATALSLTAPTSGDSYNLALLERLSDSLDNWTHEDFSSLLQIKKSPKAPLFFYLRDETLNAPLGYTCILPPTSNRPTHHTLLSLTIHPSHRRQGLGTALFLSIPPTCFPLLTRVREASDLPAQLFLRSLGFKCLRGPKNPSLPDFKYPPEPALTFLKESPPNVSL